MLTIVLLAVTYEAVRCVQWIGLVRALGIRAPLRSLTFAFLLGDATKILPTWRCAFTVDLLTDGDVTSTARGWSGSPGAAQQVLEGR